MGLATALQVKLYIPDVVVSALSLQIVSWNVNKVWAMMLYTVTREAYNRSNDSIAMALDGISKTLIHRMECFVVIIHGSIEK